MRHPFFSFLALALGLLLTACRQDNGGAVFNPVFDGSGTNRPPKFAPPAPIPGRVPALPPFALVPPAPAVVPPVDPLKPRAPMGFVPKPLGRPGPELKAYFATVTREGTLTRVEKGWIGYSADSKQAFDLTIKEDGTYLLTFWSEEKTGITIHSQDEGKWRWSDIEMALVLEKGGRAKPDLSKTEATLEFTLPSKEKVTLEQLTVISERRDLRQGIRQLATHSALEILYERLIKLDPEANLLVSPSTLFALGLPKDKPVRAKLLIETMFKERKLKRSVPYVLTPHEVVELIDRADEAAKK